MIPDYNRYIISSREKYSIAILLLIIMLFISYIFYDSVLPVVLYPLLFKMVLKVMEKVLINKRKNILLDQFKDLLYTISSCIATGRSMREALVDSKKQLSTIYTGETIIIKELEHINNLLKNENMKDTEVLEDFAVRTGLEDIRDFAEIYNICKKTGGNLIIALNKGAEIIGDKITIEREIKMITREKKFQGNIITAMPIIIILFLRWSAPDYIGVMYQTIGGKIIMTLAVMVIVAAYFIIERISKIEV